MGAAETLGHFACVCPRFREARTAAHNRAWDTVSSFIASKAGGHWKFHWDTPMMFTGLASAPVLQEEPQRGSEPLGQSESQPELVRIDNLRPDGVAISHTAKKIGILEFCRPSDSFPDQLLSAHDRKNLKYAIVERALHQYVAAGWQVEILPWVVGIRGLIEEKIIHAAVEYLDISRSEWAAAVACTVVASVQSLAFMHRVRFSSINQSRVFDTNDPVPAPSGAENRGISKKRQFSSSRLSDPSATQAKWKRMATNTGRQLP